MTSGLKSCCRAKQSLRGGSGRLLFWPHTVVSVAFEGSIMKWALEEVVQATDNSFVVCFFYLLYSSLKYFILFLTAPRPCIRPSGSDKKRDHDSNEIILLFLPFSLFLVLPKQIFRLKGQTKKPHPRPIGEIVFHIFITALVTVFPTPVALMRLGKKKCRKTSLCFSVWIKAFLIFLGWSGACCSWWALPVGFGSDPKFLNFGGGSGKGNANACGCFRVDF